MTDPAAPTTPTTEPRRTGRLDSRYWRVWGAVAGSKLGDGLVSLAFPWMASLMTRDALAISGVALATRLPWLVFSLQAGALGDRFDRRRLMVSANAVRAVIAGLTTAAVLLDVMTLPALYLAAFALGMCEVLFDNTTQSLLPSLVPRDRLERANGTLVGAHMVIADFVARPLAGAVIGVALSLPFAIDAVTAAIAAALVASIRGTSRAPHEPGDAQAPRIPMRTQIAEGMAWLWSHRLLRTLAIALAVMNGVNAAVQAVLVLFAQEALGLSAFGLGLLLTAGGVGGLLGSVVAPNLVQRIGSGPALTLTVAVPILGFVLFSMTSSPWVAGGIFAVYAFTAVCWNVVTVTLRQRVIPDALLSRVNSVYRFMGWGAMPLGALAGGALVNAVEAVAGRSAGLRAPFVLAALAHLILWAAIGRYLRTRVIRDAQDQAHLPPSP